MDLACQPLGEMAKVVRQPPCVTWVPEGLVMAGQAAVERMVPMQKMKFFVDTHDQQRGTFPPGLTPEELASFLRKYEEACRAEGVVMLRVHAGLEAGRAYCFNMAPDADAVRRVHERVGLPFDTITEVTTVTPGDLFFGVTAA